MDEFERLPHAALVLIRLRLAVVFGVIAIILGVFAALLAGAGSNVQAVVFAALALAMIGCIWWLAAIVYRSIGWRLTEGTVEVRQGVVVRQHLVVPLPSIQNVTQSSGPIARVMGLATLTVYSAGPNTPNVTIPDLTEAAAVRLLEDLLPTAP